MAGGAIAYQVARRIAHDEKGVVEQAGSLNGCAFPSTDERTVFLFKQYIRFGCRTMLPG